jgi:single-strand DNA-binding protein
MAGLPEITVAGTVVADPELKFVPSGAAVANFRIAANDRRYDQHRGEWVDAGATFLRCSIWRQAAENVAESLHRGDRVLVTGVLRQSDWETKEGEKRSSYELAVTEVGISLKFATATSNKAKRGNASTTDGDTFAPAGSGGRFADEPPF